MKTLTKRQKGILVVIIVLLGLVVVLLLSMIPVLMGGSETDEPSVRVQIPEAELTEDPATKTDSYRRSGGIGDYWDRLQEDSPEGCSAASSPAEDTGGGRRPPQVGVEDLFGDYASHEGKTENEGPPAPRRSPRKAASSEGTPQKVQAPSRQEAPPEAPKGSERKQAGSAEGTPVKRSGSVSNLDTDVSQELGNGFSTLDGTDMWVSGEAGKPYRCMFTRDEKVRSGQRVTLRLLEDLVIGGIHIPRNTHLQGVVSISERMEIAVTSLDMGGRIVSFHFEAYDTDGGKGIYCSDLSQARRSVTEQGIATITSTLSSLLGRVARDAASVGASIVRNKSGEATVSVPAGYTFYIVEQQR